MNLIILNLGGEFDLYSISRELHYFLNMCYFPFVLLVSRLDTPISSLDDLANQYKVQYAPMNGTATMTYFQRMEYIEKKFYT